MDERDRGQGSLSDKVKGSYRRVSVVMYVTLVIAAIAFCGRLMCRSSFHSLTRFWFLLYFLLRQSMIRD